MLLCECISHVDKAGQTKQAVAYKLGGIECGLTQQPKTAPPASLYGEFGEWFAYVPGQSDCWDKASTVLQVRGHIKAHVQVTYSIVAVGQKPLISKFKPFCKLTPYLIIVQ